MEKTPHIYFAFDGAEAFPREQVSNSYSLPCSIQYKLQKLESVPNPISMICILLPLSFFFSDFYFSIIWATDWQIGEVVKQLAREATTVVELLRAALIQFTYLFSNMHKNGSWYLCTLI